MKDRFNMKNTKSLALAILIFPVIVAAGKPLISTVYEWSRMKMVRTHTGAVTNILKEQTKSLESLEIKAVTLYSGKDTHSYPEAKGTDEMFVLSEGTAGMTINSVTRELGPGSVAVASQGDRVMIKNSEHESLVFYSFVFKPRFAAPSRQAAKKIRPFFSSWDTIAYNSSENGGTRNILNLPTATLKHLDVSETTLNEGCHDSIDLFSGEELILVKKGSVGALVNEKKSVCGQGSVIYFTSGENSAIFNAGAGECEYFTIRWKTPVKSK
ncbi:MAG: hypothetical protein ABSG89_11820 [Bacteroidales bacterium]|jgi:uncharacterized cupin superfamily protein